MPPTEEGYLYQEDQAIELARLAHVAAGEHGAPMWALDLMEGGLDAVNLRGMANAWRDYTFEPPSFAIEVERLADAIESEGE